MRSKRSEEYTSGDKMTHDELMALRDVTPRIERQERIIDGVRRSVLVQEGGFAGVLWQTEDEPLEVHDEAGIWWEVGWLRSEQVRRRSSSWARIVES